MKKLEKVIRTTVNENVRSLSIMVYIRSFSIWNILWVQFMAEQRDISLLQSIGHRITSYPMGCNHRDKAARLEY
jgi:hypothetical protein